MEEITKRTNNTFYFIFLFSARKSNLYIFKGKKK